MKQATQDVEAKFLEIVRLTRQMYDNNNGLLRMRVLKRLPKDKQELRTLLVRLGIRNLRPVDIAWNYVVFYNEKIRQLWNDCDLGDPDERRRVMRHILELDEKREQRLADVDQSPDCFVKFWTFQGWNRAEYDEVYRAVQAERIEKSKPVEQHEPAEQQHTPEETELAITQTGSTATGLLNDVNGCSEPMSSFERSGETNFDTAFENTTSSQEYDADRPGLDAFEKSLFATRSESKPGEGIIDDNDSLFGDGDDDFVFGVDDDDQLNTAPVSSLGVEEANTAEKASNAPPVIQHTPNEEAIDINDSLSDDPFFGDSDYHQSASAPAPGQAVEGVDTAENVSHASPATTQGSLVEDVVETNQSGSVSSVPHEGSQVEPAAAPGQAAEKPLTRDTNTIADASANQQISQEQQAIEPQQMPNQSDLADSQAGPQHRVPGERYIPLYTDLLREIPDSHQGVLQKLRQEAREELSRFWPDGKQNCSDIQLDMFALGVVQFKAHELARYELCQALGKDYVVDFQEEYEEIPPNMTLTPICNGAAWFYCLVQNNPGTEPESEPEFVDLTGDDDSTSCAMAAPLDEPQPALAAPAEVSAASEPARPTADAEVARKGRKAPRKSKKTPRKVDTIQTPSPVDQATFTQSSASLTSNPEPTTPVNDGDAGDNGTWSSDWSGKAFSGGGQPPKTPTDQEVVVMERSVSDDNTMRKTSPTDEAAGTKKSRRKARTGDASGSVTSAQSAHAALQSQLAVTEQAPGNVNAPPSAAPGSAAGASTTEKPEQGKKRGRKCAKAAADTDVSQGQQHGTPEQQQQPTPYYGVSPEHRADPKKWVEEYTQGGKGKKTQKRKAAEPKETPSPRKARKTREVTPAAPRIYRRIAPAPPRNHDDAGDVQMQSRPGSPMDHDGTASYSPDVQITGQTTPMQSAAPQMPHCQFQQPMPPRIYQQPFQNAQQQQYAQPPAVPQNGWNNHMQQQHTSQAGGETLEERKARLAKELDEVDQKLDKKNKDHEVSYEVAAMKRRIAQLENCLVDQHPVQPYPTSHDTWAPPRQGNFQPSYHGNRAPPRQGSFQPPHQGHWAPPQQQGNAQPQVDEGSYEAFFGNNHWMGQPPSQPPMGAPQTMANRGMPPHGAEPRPRNMHGGYWQGPPPPAAAPQQQPMPYGFTQAGYPGTGNFNQTTQGGNGQGPYGGY